MAVMVRWISRLALLLVMAMALPGCAAGKLAGAMLQANEDQKKIEVLPKYKGLENQRVAVLVDADMSTLYEHPAVVANIAGGVSARIQKFVPGTKVVPANAIINWQYRTPQWNTLPYGELAEQLNVDRVVHINLTEY